MTEEQMRDVIRLIIDAVEDALRPRRGLVLFTGALLGFDASLACLSRVRDRLDMAYVLTPSAERILDHTKIAALGIAKADKNLVGTHDLLIVPTLTANTVAKVACGMADSLATNLISEFLMTGKRVVAASTAADPDSLDKRTWFPSMPTGQASLLRDNLRRMKALGVLTCEAADLAEAIDAALPTRVTVPNPDSSLAATSATQPPSAEDSSTSDILPAGESHQEVCPDRLIAGRHIQFLPSGSTLIVRRDAIVTHWAIDLARTRSISIKRA